LWVRVEDFLDLAREELLAAPIDDLLAAAGDLHVAGVVDGTPEIASAKPAMLEEHGGVGGRIVVVAEMHARPTGADFTDLAARHVIAGVVDDAHLHRVDHA